jgi:hypothetical protein
MAVSFSSTRLSVTLVNPKVVVTISMLTVVTDIWRRTVWSLTLMWSKEPASGGDQSNRRNFVL